MEPRRRLCCGWCACRSRAFRHETLASGLSKAHAACGQHGRIARDHQYRVTDLADVLDLQTRHIHGSEFPRCASKDCSAQKLIPMQAGFLLVTNKTRNCASNGEAPRAHPGIVVLVKLYLKCANLLWLDEVNVVYVDVCILHRQPWMNHYAFMLQASNKRRSMPLAFSAFL